MKSISAESVLSALEWRYATKKFDPTRQIPDEDWKALESALVLTPSSYGLQPWRFIVVTNPETKKLLSTHSWKQNQPADCSHHVVFTIRKGINSEDVRHYIDRIVTVRGGAKEKLAGFEKLMIGSIEQAAARGELDMWVTYQVYIALGQFMTTAAMLGIDTCPMEGIVASEYDKVLNLVGSGYATVVACAAGYRAADDFYAKVSKVRFPPSEVVHYR